MTEIRTVTTLRAKRDEIAGTIEKYERLLGQARETGWPSVSDQRMRRSIISASSSFNWKTCARERETWLL